MKVRPHGSERASKVAGTSARPAHRAPPTQAPRDSVPTAADEFESEATPAERAPGPRHRAASHRFHLHRGKDALSDHLDEVAPNRTQKAVLGRVKGSFFGAELGVNIAEAESVENSNRQFEVVQVAGLSGSQAIETNLAKADLGNGNKLVLQGPGLKVSPDPARPVSARVVGLGVSSSLPSNEEGKKLTATASVKVTDKTVLELAAMGGSKTADLTTSTVAALAGQEAAELVGDVVLGAIPIVSAALAANSVRRAVTTFRDESSTRQQRGFAVAHAVVDAVRVACPPVGIAGSAALAGVEAGTFYRQVHKAKQEVAEASSAGA